MANLDQPKGLEPWGECLRSRPYVAGGTVYPGDTLKQEDTGKLIVATASDACIGVCLSYGVSGDEILVADHPDQEFMVQSDDATEPAAQTAIGLNYNLIYGSANTTYRTSGVELDGSTGATTATLPVKALRLAPIVGNAFGANAKLIVKINNHQLGSHTGTAGV